MATVKVSNSGPVGSKDQAVVDQKTKSGEKIVVRLDMGEERVLELDRSGATLIFSGDPARFVKLSSAGYKGLGSENRQRYAYALEEYEALVQEDGTSDVASMFKIDPSAVRADDRLNVSGRDPRYEYSWKKPENVERFLAKGGEVVPRRAGEKTLNTTGSAHVITRDGKDELVLCRIPKEVRQKHRVEGEKRLAKFMEQGKQEFAQLVKEAKAEVVESKED